MGGEAILTRHAIVDRDGWHAVMAVLPSVGDGDAARSLVVFKTVDPDGFGLCSARSLPVPDALGDGTIEAECRRFLDRLVDGGPAVDGIFGRVGPHPDVRNDDGWIGGRGAVQRIAYLRPQDETLLAPLLDAPVFAERTAKGSIERPWMRSADRNPDPAWNPIFVLPETRAVARAVVDARPWMLPVLTRRRGFARRLVEAWKEGMPLGMTAGGIAAGGTRWHDEEPMRAGVWTERAVACLDRFFPGMDPDLPVGDAYAFVHAVGALPPSWTPRTEEEFEALYRLAPLVRQDFVEDGRHFAELLAPSKGRFDDLLAALVPGPPDGRFLHDAWGGIHDACVDVHLRLVMPVLDRAGAYDERTADIVANRLMTDGGGILLVKERAAVWHRRFRTLPGLDGGRRRTAWPLLASAFPHVDGGLAFLGSSEDLEKEGDAMEHCVASYAAACATGASHVASVRGTDGTRLSTAEFSLDEDGDVVLVQHLGSANGPPPVVAVRVVEAWMSAVRDGAVRLDPEACAPREAESVVFVVPEAGTPRDWKGVLQGRLVRMGWDGLVDEIIATADRVRRERASGRGWL